MSDQSLEIKIKTLVEGLDSLNRVINDIKEVGQAAKATGQQVSDGKSGFKDLETEAQAYKTIGVRSFAEVRDEIARVEAAHKLLINSSSLTKTEMAAETEATKSKLAALNSELKGLNTSNTEAAGSGGMLSKALGMVAPEVDVVSSGVGLLTDNIGKVVSAFMALAVAYGLKESADYAARTETLGITMNVVAKNAGYGATEIGRYEKEVKGLGITTQGTREAITQMIQAGLEIGPKAEGQVSQVAKLARAAQDLAVVTGENSSATLTRLITNIAQLDTVGLRYMGLTVNVEAAERQFALSIGKTVDQLTQKQKAQAVMDEALKQSEKLSGAYEASMESVGKKVQSLKRYQEELANDIGSKLLPAYGALVDSATQFLKAADLTVQGIDRSGASSRLLADGVKSFGGAMGDSLNTVLSMFGELYPSLAGVGKGFMDLLALVIRVGSEILTLGHYTDSAGNKITGLGLILHTLLSTVALLLGGVKDGVDIITAAFYGLGGASLDIIGRIIEGFGLMVSYVNKDWGKAIQQTGKDLQQTGTDMMGFADSTVEQFGRGESAVGKFRKSLSDARLAQKQMNDVTDFSKAEAEVLKLVEAVRKQGIYTADADEKSKLLSQQLVKLKESGSLTEKQLGELQQILRRLSADEMANFSKAVNDAGLKVTELGGKDRLAPLNKEFDVAKATVQELGSSTKATGDVLQDAFAHGVNAAKSLAELNQIGASLGDVKKASEDIQPAMAEVNLKFDELFDKSLKAARTQRQFEDLRAEVIRLGQNGVISGDTVARALKDITEKATQAEESISRIAKQAAEMARANADMAKAHLDMIRAEIDVKRSELDVWAKRNDYIRDATPLHKAELEFAEANLKLVRAKAEEAKLSYDTAIAAQNQLIALQQKLNAEKEVEIHIGEEDVDIYKNKAKEAADAVRDAERLLSASREQLAMQQQIVAKLEEEKALKGLTIDQEKALVEEKKKMADYMNKMNSSTQEIAKNTRETATATGEMSSGLSHAADAAGRLASNMSMAAAQARDLKAQQELKERYGGLGSVDDKNITTKDGQNLRYLSKDHYTNDQGVVVDKNGNPSSTSSDGTGSIPMDRDIAELLYRTEHGMSVDPTPENVKRAEAAFKAAAANLEVYQRNSHAFSNAGAESVMREYNRARLLLDLVKGAGLRTGQQDYNTLAPGALNGSHRDGLERVPFDGYIAELHEGEQVLTAAEATARRNAPSIDELSQAFLSRLTRSASQLPAIAQQAAASQAPSKTIQINLMSEDGRRVEMQTAESNEQDLLSMLRNAKRVST